jgi:ABC-type transport system substrate-binding protein
LVLDRDLRHSYGPAPIGATEAPIVGSGRGRLAVIHRSPSARRTVVLLATLLSLVAAACGGGSDGAGGEGGVPSDVTLASGEPQPGGTVVFGLEAESDGFNPTSNRWAISGLMVANAVFDPLAAYDAEGRPQPYLAQAFVPSEDYTTWVIELREGVTFHDGTALDAAAVKKDLDAARASTLVGAALSNIASIEVDPTDPLKVVVTMESPWASFPATLTGQVGFIAAPAQLDADGEATSSEPIGTGPFVYESWEPDKAFVATRNPDYWRTDDAGNQLPYLDRVEFRPIVDPTNRVNALVSGDLQMMHTTDWTAMGPMRSQAADGNIQLVADETESEESFVLLNTTAPPLDDVRVRRALALCTDREQVATVGQVPLDRITDSQFAPDSPWYDPENGYPALDVQAGTDLIAEVAAESGPVSVELVTTPVPANTATTQVLAQQWERCGVDVTLNTSEQSTFISNAVTGNYQANLWRQFGATDPDGDYVWWIGANATGPLALNLARLADPQIDAALNEARATADEASRQQAYAELQRRQSELLPYLWLYRSQWVIGAANPVRNLTNVSLPDGSPAQPFQSGNVRLTQTWLQP